jgi:hypothetical protein
MHDASPAADRGRPARVSALALLTAAALAVRIVFLLVEPATQPVADERTWTNWAVENLVTPKVGFSPFRTRMIFYPPFYPYFIAVFYAAFGTLAAVKWAQVVVGALLVPAVGRVGERAFGREVGVVAAAVTAFYPELVWFSVHFWSETLFMLFLWWAFERLLAADAAVGAASWRSRGVSVAFVAGLVWGLAVLTRETVLYAAPLAAVWLAGRTGQGGRRRGAAFLVGAVLVIAPWTYRNWVVFRAFVPVATAGGLNLWQGNARLSRQEVYDQNDAVQGRIAQYQHARRKGIEAILERQPTWIFEKLRDEMPNFWEADSLALIHIRRGAYGPVAVVPAVAAAAVVLVPYLLVLALFVAGVAASRLDRAALLLLGFLIYYVAIHVATHGFARYRLPALPVVFLFAASAAVAVRARTWPRLAARRTAVAAALALVLGASLAPSIVRLLQEPAYGLAPSGPRQPDRDAGPPAEQGPTQ